MDDLIHNKMINFLFKCQDAYYRGNPIITDEEFDSLALQYHFDKVGYDPTENKNKHLYRMYSLQKVYVEDNPTFPQADIITSSKLDGSAISLLYINGTLSSSLTRGDGIVGEDITDKIIAKELAPLRINLENIYQINGEVVTEKTVENARNYVAGALHLKSMDEYMTRNLTFIAYSIEPNITDTYTGDILKLKDLGFNTVLDSDWSQFPRDGRVVRLDSNILFNEMGYTAKHPRGAWALKKKADVETVTTTLREVKWQLGKGGKVTPVAIFDEVIIEDAKITKATLHNPGFVEEWDLNIGDTLLITRSGGIIPQVIGKI